MPTSKRNRVVPLSKVAKKGFNDRKTKLFTRIHKYLKEYKYCFAFSYKNMTNMSMNALKEYFSDSIFIVGKNKVIQVALGKPDEDEPKENSSKLSPYLKGNCGLFFTNKDPDDIIQYFKEYKCPYFGNVGTISNQTVILKRGFDEHLADFPPSMEGEFRQLGLKIKLDNGKYCMLDDYTVCEEGKPLTPEQSKMIKHLGIYMDEFKIEMKAYLGDNGQFEIVQDNE